MVREMKIQETVYELLTQQYEQAKIMEAKDTPTVQILDRASPPEKKSIPKRGRIVIYSAIWGVIFGIFLAFFAEWYDKVKKQPEEFAKISFWLSEIKKDLNYLKSKILYIVKFKKSPS